MPKKPPKKPSGDGGGYCRPPKAHRFRPGQSGNPRGRPRGVPTLQEAMTREAAKLVKVKQGDEIIKVPKIVALARRVFAKALEGDLAATRIVFQLSAEPGTSEASTQKEAFVIPGDAAIRRMIARFDHLNTPQGDE